VLRDGRLVQTAAPAALYRQPVDLDVARFVGEAVVLAGEARGGTVTCVLGTLAVRGEEMNGPVQVMLRPEQIRLASSGNGRVAARVVGRSFYGAETELHLELLDGSGTAVVARTFDDGDVQIGDERSVVVEGSATVYSA
jgi:iron(III) transport system ATP-binding protein